MDRVVGVAGALLGVACLWGCGDRETGGGAGAGGQGGTSSGGSGAVAGAGAMSSGGAGAEGGVGAAGAAGGQGGAGAVGGCGPDGPAPDEIFADGGLDPLDGDFTLDDALEGLPPGDGPLRAIITTTLGEITCTLEPELVPYAVANFVGLARGYRPWFDQPSGNWVKRPFYDGLIFHRVIDDFMAQGGDPNGTGTGSAGYKFDDEIIAGLVHQPGTLAYANSGPNSNSSQFYITEVATDWLDGGYTIFGLCEPMTTIETITASETGANDKPLEDIVMTSIEITRCPLEQ